MTAPAVTGGELARPHNRREAALPYRTPAGRLHLVYPTRGGWLALCGPAVRVPEFRMAGLAPDLCRRCADTDVGRRIIRAIREGR